MSFAPASACTAKEVPFEDTRTGPGWRARFTRKPAWAKFLKKCRSGRAEGKLMTLKMKEDGSGRAQGKLMTLKTKDESSPRAEEKADDDEEDPLQTQGE